MLVTSLSFAQVGIGTPSPDASSILDLTATDKGFLSPRMNAAQRNAIISPAEGLTIYNTDLNCLEFHIGSSTWISTCANRITGGACDGATAEFTFKGLTYKTIESEGECWLDRNLGATALTGSARSSYASDAAYILAESASFGDYYQWGRNSDGHEDRTSNIAPGPVTAGNEGNDFLTNSDAATFRDWLTPQDDNRWADGLGNKTVNDPCPAGYRVRTSAEFNTELNSWSSQDPDGAFDSPLKLPLAGRRNSSTGAVNNEGAATSYWSSSVGGANPTAAISLNLTVGSLFTPGGIATVDAGYFRANGVPLRCLKD